MKFKLWVAMGIYALLAVLAWTTLTERIPSSGLELRWAMIGFLGLMAFLTWARRHPAVEGGEQQRD
jgi:hypothetical protein